MRPMLCAAAFLYLLAACVPPPPPGPGMLLLSNPGVAPARIEAVMTTASSCALRGPGTLATATFPLPGKATRFLAAPAGADVCWRRAVHPPEPDKPKWSGWSRALTASGRVVDSEL